jgi:hypothetical protein
MTNDQATYKQPAQIPAGLQALLQATAALSSPTAPGPNGPQPTVANRLSQALAQKAGEAQPQGIMGAMPDLNEIGKQAGIAGQIQNQNLQQQAQQAKDPQAVAMMAAQMLQKQQSPGVAGQPSGMQFKEGGIIGFSGEEGSEAKLTEEAKKLAEETKGKAPSAAEAHPRSYEAGQRAAQMGKGIAKLARRTAPLVVAGEIAENMGNYKLNSPENIDTSLSGTVSDIGKGEFKRAGKGLLMGAGEAALDLGKSAAGLADYVLPGTPASDAYDKMVRRNLDLKGNAPDTGDETARLKARIPTQIESKPLVEGEGVPASERGIPSVLNQPEKPTAPQAPIPAQIGGGKAMAMPNEPTMKGILSQVDQEFPAAARAKSHEETLRGIAGERSQLKRGQEDLSQRGIEALNEAENERLDIQRRKAERDQINRTAAFFRDLETRGNQYYAVQDAIFAREDADKIAKLAHKQGVIKLKEAQQLKALGYLDDAEKLEKEVYAMYADADKARREAAALYEKLEGGVYGKKMEAFTGDAGNRSRENVAFAQLKSHAEIENAKMLQKAQELGDARTQAQVTQAAAQVTAALKERDSLDEKNKSSRFMSEEARAKNPAFQRDYDQYMKARDDADANIRRAIAVQSALGKKLGLDMGEAPKQAGGNATTKAQYDALPKGATYTAPDGTQRIKG